MKCYNVKKIVFALVIATGYSFSQAKAQGLVQFIKEKLSIGLKVEAVSSNFILSNMSGVKSDMNIGGAFGPSLKLDISKHFAIQEDILFTYKSSKLKQNGISGDLQFFGTEIPFYALVQWKTINKDRFYIGLGPYAALGFSAKDKINGADINLYNNDSGNVESIWNRMEIGAGALIGYEFSCGLQVNASYKIGMTNVLKTNIGNAKMRTNTASIGWGYCF
ncbi:MAG: porin family protein [Bacteroidota bacterium]|nr:porin family protein [Bacteroidota bacterium]